MNVPVSSSDFLSLWDVLAKPSGCRELKEAWNRILEHAEKIGADAMDTLWDFYLERLGELEGKTVHSLTKNKKEKKMGRRTVGNSLIAGVIGIVLLAGSIKAADASQQSVSSRKIYQVFIAIKSPDLSHPWKSFFETSFDKRTTFQSVREFSSTNWYGIRGWVKVERDGLHYKILIKDQGKASQIFRGLIPGNRKKYRINLTDKI